MADETNTILFLAIVALGAAVQTVTGFAMGLVIMTGVALFGIADISFAAAVVSLVSMVNAAVALRRGYRHIDWHYVRAMISGLIPLMFVGLWLLDYLSTNNYGVLRLLLGMVIVTAGTLLMISPAPFAARSSVAATVACGTLGGVLTGLYSAGGAPLAYFMYRQPIGIDTIRFTLLTVFGLTTATRSFMIGVTGQLSWDILIVAAVSVPVVVSMTVGFTRLTPMIPDRIVRVLVFIVLLLSGMVLIAESIYESDFSIQSVSQYLPNL
ncbi:MAG: sulfite exporter TauE/SafE family protein [Proteobacteria bacterium]|nr:sulfite exporter TauE/SafE family protein [Pseudomonadota bacterium]